MINANDTVVINSAMIWAVDIEDPHAERILETIGRQSKLPELNAQSEAEAEADRLKQAVIWALEALED